MIEPKTGEDGPEYQLHYEHPLPPGAAAHFEPLEHQKQIDGLVEDLRQQVAEEVPRRASRIVYWVLGTFSLVLMAALAVALLLPESEAKLAGQLHEANLCRERQTAVMRAIDRYTSDQGRPPETLDTLRPSYLAEPPVDPTSGLPYRYSVRRDVIGLSCPKHLLPQ